MKSKGFLLLKVQLSKLFGWNRMRYSKDSSEKKKSIGYIILVGVVGVLIWIYMFGITFGLCVLGMKEDVPALMMTLTGVLVLVTTFIKCNGILFGSRDYEMLISLPIKPSVIIRSRFVTLYVMNVLFTLGVMVPSGIVCILFGKTSIWFLMTYFLSIFLVPLFPMIIAIVFGALIMGISTKTKHSNLVAILLSLTLCCIVIIGSFSIQEVEVQELTEISTVLRDSVYQLYPVAKLYQTGVCGENFISFLIFAGGSIGSYYLFVKLISLKYKKINYLLSTHKQAGNYKMRSMKEGSPFLALYKKELRRYFSSFTYVVNTLVGAIMIVLFGGSLLVMKPEQIQMYIQLPGGMQMIARIVPYIISVLVCITCTTGCSISLEGKHIWILQSLPLKSNLIYKSKMAVNLTITIPSIIMSGILACLGLKISFLHAIWVFLVPIVYAIFSAQFGIMLDIKFHNLHWESEAEVVKRGVSNMITLFAGMIIAAIPILFVLVFRAAWSFIIHIIVIMILLGITYLMYYNCSKKDMSIFRS